MDIPATSDNIPGTLVLRDATGSCSFGPLKTGNPGSTEVIYATRTSAPFRINHTDGSGRVNISWNVDGANHNIGTAKYFNTDPSVRLRLTTTGFEVFTAPAGIPGELIAAWTVGLCNTIAGLVGIGTATPGAKLNVVHNDTTDAVRITQEGSGNALVVEDSANPDSTPFIVTAAGNVGIGATLAGNKLTVRDGDVALVSGVNAADAGHAVKFFANQVDDASNNYAEIKGGLVNAATPQQGYLRFSTSGSERMRITSAGNVGIGTTTPTVELDVNGTVKAAGFSADGIQIEGLSGRNYFRDSEAVGELRVGAAWGLPGIYSEFGRCVVGGQGGVSIEPVGASNVGVGTSTPSSKAILEVSSTTRGFLPPRMTTTERDAITSPPAGLMLYNNTTNKLQVRTDTTWVDLH